MLGTDSRAGARSAPSLGSSIYTGSVVHRRAAPRAHALRYGVFYLLLDLDELPVLDACSRLFGYNRAAWFSFHDVDHGYGDGTPFRAWLDAALDTAGIDAGDWHFRVLCMPRVLGYVFNPITVVYCYAPDGRLGAMVYEVNNTFGERLGYVVPVHGDDATRGILRQRCEKALFVSPFFDMQGHYEFSVRPPGARLALGIDYREGDALRLRAVFSGQRHAFAASTLRALAWRYPAATLKVITAIHYEALKLWLKGVPVVRHVTADGRAISTGKAL
ncbi:MAG: DUF1365 domain-containing protein [Gammaproteobacteria bacterium]